jgi:segregation and condensation protein B
MEFRLEKEAALVETVLFLESEPQDELALSRATGLGRDVIDKALEILVEEYAGNAHGLEPIRSGGGWILAPKAELWSVLKERYGRKSESRMSKAALETLSIIAYSQPVTRAEIEGIRGVSADGMIRFLLERGFIKETGKKDAPGKPVQFGTTREFLKYFRLGSIADLPHLGELERERFGDDAGDEGAPELAEEAGAETSASEAGLRPQSEDPGAGESSPPASTAAGLDEPLSTEGLEDDDDKQEG